MEKIIIKKIYLIRSSNGETFYEVDVDLLTCTCPDFVYRRDHLSSENPERLCKHLKEVLDFLKKEEEKKKVFLSRLKGGNYVR